MKNKLTFFWFYQKLTSRMKLTILTLCFCVLQVSATVSTKGQGLNLNVKDQTIKGVFKIIEDQTNYRFFFNDVYSDLNKTVTLDLNNKTIQQVMDELLSDSRVSYKIFDDNLIVIAPTVELQQILVKGAVTDANTEEALPGVNIIIEGTTTGVISDMNGQYSIEVTGSDAVLSFSFVGYLTENIKINGQTVINVTLVPDVTSLDEVVVVGYGIIKKANLTGAVDNVSGEVLTKRPGTNSANLLQGRLTGVDIIQPTAEPGKENPIIQIRGKGSYGAESDTKNDPLILIDGVSGSLNNLSPNDIESVSVLKDAASASIYGARAANGVILVTTKKGKKGAPVITYSGNISIQSPTRLPEVITNSAEYMEMYNRAAYRQNLPFKYSEEQIENYRNPPDSLKDYYPNFNAYDYWYGNAIVHNHNISVAGGGENSMYNASFSYLNQNAMLPGYRFKRYNALINYTLDINKWLTLGTIVNMTHKYDKKPPMHDVFLPLYITTANPLNEAYLPDGSGRVVSQAYRGEPRSRNPAEVYLMGNYYSKENNLNGQAYIDFKPFKGLTWTTKFAIDYTDRFFKTHQQAYTTNYLHFMSGVTT